MRKTIVVIADSFHERYLIDSGLLDTSREDLIFYVFETFRAMKKHGFGLVFFDFSMFSNFKKTRKSKKTKAKQ